LTVAYLGLGANLGDRRATLNAAVEALDWGKVRVIARSAVYQTDPVGGPEGQPAFLNQVVAVESSLSARELWERCVGIETALGRVRAGEERWGPRAIDIDLLLVGEEVVADEDLIIPHPRMHGRAFVLVPLVEIAPHAVIPGHGSARALLQGISTTGVRRLDG